MEAEKNREQGRARLQGQKADPRAPLETGALTQGVGNSQLVLLSERRGVQRAVVSLGAGPRGLTHHGAAAWALLLESLLGRLPGRATPALVCWTESLGGWAGELRPTA